MSERYSRVFSLPENLYSVGSPVVISAGALQKDNQTGGILAQIKMKNISAKVIKAVKVKLTLFDVAGNILADGVEQQYLDLRVVRDESFGSKSAIKLKESTTRSFAVNIIEVVFEDRSVWNGTTNPWETLSQQTALINYFNDEELVKQFELTYGAPCHNVLLEEKDLWSCTCGALNKDNEPKCHKCGKSLKALKELDISALGAEKEKRLEEERIAAKEQAERERKVAEIAKIKAEAKKKRIKKVSAIVTPIVAVLAVVFMLVYNMILVPNSKYNDAVVLMDNGQYKEAIAAFEAIDGYKDSEAQIEACNYALNDIKYNDAVILMTIGKYEEAAAAFKKIENHKDSIEQIEACNYALNDIKYNDAIALMNGSEYYKAISIFESIVNHKDSVEQIEVCHNIIEKIEEIESAKLTEIKEMLRGLKEGDCFNFGVYEQDNNINNGKEDIEWIVLKISTAEQKVLVISKYALDCQPYHTELGDVTWETCSLRRWLNNDFINSAFTEEGRKSIPVVTVPADKNPQYSTNPGNATLDQVFLLSINEANKYFKPNSAMECEATYYADAHGLWVSDSGTCTWWLRSPGDTQDSAVVFDDYFSIYERGLRASSSEIAVRPAMWFSLD